LYLELGGRVKKMLSGDSALVMPGVWHSFWTDTGAIIEEISTTHFNNDSFYKDPSIQNKKREDRKTVVDHWGRYELNDYLASG
jgi:N-acetylneuraminate synthase